MLPQSRVSEYYDYHELMYGIGDIDPGYEMLRYVCDRFEVNPEQRYWMCFLYAATYSVATTYYIYNRFPDFECVDLADMGRWWDAEGREACIFQSDRSWIRSRNQFVQMVQSYRDNLGGSPQAHHFMGLLAESPAATYRNCFESMGEVFQMGRFALFLHLEAIHVVTGFGIEPDGLDLRRAESSRNGICYAIGRDDLLTGKDGLQRQLTGDELEFLAGQLQSIIAALKIRNPSHRTDVWNVETTLCAYKKYKRGKRYPGYYIDRQGGEIAKMMGKVKDGVDWSPLWDYRQESIDCSHLAEALGGELQNINWSKWRD